MTKPNVSGRRLRAIGRLAVIATVVGCPLLLVFGVHGLARHDIQAAARSVSPNATAKITPVNLSATYGVYYQATLSNGGEVNAGYWRLVPFRRVELVK
jgi:hypothetical protein